jgi:hypothetical protein
MINEYEAQLYIDSHLPGIVHLNDVPGKKASITEIVTDMASMLKQRFADKDWMSIKQIFHVAEHLLTQGNNMVKMGVQNVFIYSISSIMPAERSLRCQFQALIPITLFSIYVQQILHSNI